MNKVEYSKLITGEKESFYFKIDNLDFSLTTFGNHDKAYIFLITEKNINHNGQRQKCLYTIEENNTIIITDIEPYFIFIAKHLKDYIEDFLFKDFNLKQKLENKLIEKDCKNKIIKI